MKQKTGLFWAIAILAFQTPGFAETDSPRLNFRIYRNLYLTWNVMSIERAFNSRQFLLPEIQPEDEMHSTTIGLRYWINKDNSFFLNYAYRETFFNKLSQEYSGSAVKCGWMFTY